MKSEPFTNKTKIIFVANGIGLYMAKVQIESVGGLIDMQSQVYEGSNFTITI